jgi:hypothetical protein
VGLGLLAHGIRAQTPSTQAPSGAISGVVIDATTGQPVAGAIVALARLDAQITIPRSVTDGKGRFLFKDLPASDQYYLGARRFGYDYTAVWLDVAERIVGDADIARISIANAQWVEGLRIPLWRSASISGRVVDERGEPLVGVVVRVFSRANISGQPQLVGGDLAVTDDLGNYRVAGLSPGRYAVAVLSVQSTVPRTMMEAPVMSAIGQLAGSGISSTGGGALTMPALDVDPNHRLAITNFPTPPPPAADQARAYALTFHPWSPNDRECIEHRDQVRRRANRHRHSGTTPVPAARVSGRLSLPAGRGSSQDAAPPDARRP